MSGRYGRDEALFVRVFLLPALLLAGLFLLILLAALAAAALLTALLAALAALSALALTALTLLVVLTALAALLSGTVHIISHREFSIVVDRTLPHEKNLCAYDWFLVAEQQMITKQTEILLRSLTKFSRNIVVMQRTEKRNAHG